VIQECIFGEIRVLAHFATADQKQRYLAPLLRGEEVIAVAMTEPGAGSATTDLVTSATPEGAGYRINGSKVFPNPHADQYLVYVRYGPGVGGIGSVMLRRTAPGFSTGKPSKFMSGNDWATLYFDNVYVPPEDVLLGPGGFKKQIAGFNVERVGNASRSLAYGRYCYEAARTYAMTRTQFGRPLCEFQGLQWKFADMRMKLDAGQLLLYRAAVNADGGIPSAEETAIAKAYCNQAGFDICNEAMQIMGGMGYTTETLVEYCFRKCRGWMIAGGSIEILKNRIAESVFERSFSQRPSKS
jgi:alkylation response protein AidB-like acyl-CoA dehydrogenase